MSFVITVLIVSISCAVISYKTLFSYTNLNKKSKFSLFLLLLVSWFMPLISFIIQINNPSYLLDLFTTYIGYSLFIFVALLFALHFTRDVIWFVLWGIKKLFKISFKFPSPEDTQALKKANLYSVYIALFILLCGLYSGNKIADIKEISIPTNKISQEVKLVLLSDLHIKNIDSKNTLNKIVKKVNDQNADIVILAGDTIGGNLDKIVSKLDVLRTIKSKYGTYTVIGNHEAYNGMLASMKYFNSGEGYKLLFNTGNVISDKNLFIGGVTDTDLDKMFQPDVRKSLIGSSDEYKILISHRPNIFNKAAKNGYDLTLSGHTHGGQVFPFHYFAKEFNGYLSGFYENGNSKLYITRGVRYWGPAVRFFSPSEITVIRLIPSVK